MGAKHETNQISLWLTLSEHERKEWLKLAAYRNVIVVEGGRLVERKCVDESLRRWDRNDHLMPDVQWSVELLVQLRGVEIVEVTDVNPAKDVGS